MASYSACFWMTDKGEDEFLDFEAARGADLLVEAWRALYAVEPDEWRRLHWRLVSIFEK